MALPVPFSLLHSDLNDFLFASIGEEQNGVTLSVVSALTRLGVDPWEEAARLTPLPKARAAETLAKLIARLPIRRTESWDDLVICRRLVELLPADKPARSLGCERAGAGQRKYWGALILSPALLSPPQFFPACCNRVRPVLRGNLLAPTLSQTGNKMKYLVPPIVIPALLLIGVLAFGMLRPPIIVGHAPVPTAHSQAR